MSKSGSWINNHLFTYTPYILKLSRNLEEEENNFQTFYSRNCRVPAVIAFSVLPNIVDRTTIFGITRTTGLWGEIDLRSRLPVMPPSTFDGNCQGMIVT